MSAGFAGGDPAALWSQAIESYLDQTKQLFDVTEMARAAFLEEDTDKTPLEIFCESLRDALGAWRLQNRTSSFYSAFGNASANPFTEVLKNMTSGPANAPFGEVFKIFGAEPKAAADLGPMGALLTFFDPAKLGTTDRFELRDDWQPQELAAQFSRYLQLVNSLSDAQLGALNSAVEGVGGNAGASSSPGELGTAWVESMNVAFRSLDESESYQGLVNDFVATQLAIFNSLWRHEPGDSGNTSEHQTSSDLADVKAELARLGDAFEAMSPVNLKDHVGELTDEINDLRDEVDQLKSSIKKLTKKRAKKSNKESTKTSTAGEPTASGSSVRASRPKRPSKKKAGKGTKAKKKPTAKTSTRTKTKAVDFDIDEIIGVSSK